jgi:uncharacterized protein YfiM (DUF2279 family)
MQKMPQRETRRRNPVTSDYVTNPVMKTKTRLSVIARSARWLGAVAIVAFALFAPAAGSAGPAHGQDQGRRQRQDQRQGQEFSISGRVESVDYDANTITVRAHGESYLIAITPTTVVEHAGQVGSIADLRPRARVHVRGVTQDGQMTAVSIVIRGNND